MIRIVSYCLEPGNLTFKHRKAVMGHGFNYQLKMQPLVLNFGDTIRGIMHA